MTIAVKPAALQYGLCLLVSPCIAAGSEHRPVLGPLVTVCALGKVMAWSSQPWPSRTLMSDECDASTAPDSRRPPPSPTLRRYYRGHVVLGLQHLAGRPRQVCPSAR